MTKTLPFFLLMVAFGFGILLLPANVFPGGDLWDNPALVYLLLGGVGVAGFFKPVHFWLWPIGIYLGGVIHLMMTRLLYRESEASAWWQLGFVVLTLSLIPLYFACGLGRVGTFLVQKIKEKQRV